MPNYIMTRPRFTAEDFDDEKQRRKIIAWLVQLDEQLRYLMGNLDEENLSQGLSDTIVKTSGAIQLVSEAVENQQAQIELMPDQISIAIAAIDEFHTAGSEIVLTADEAKITTPDFIVTILTQQDGSIALQIDEDGAVMKVLTVTERLSAPNMVEKYTGPLTITVGTGGDYSSLQAAVETVNGKYIAGDLTVTLLSDVYEDVTIEGIFGPGQLYVDGDGYTLQGHILIDGCTANIYLNELNVSCGDLSGKYAVDVTTSYCVTLYGAAITGPGGNPLAGTLVHINWHSGVQLYEMQLDGAATLVWTGPGCILDCYDIRGTGTRYLYSYGSVVTWGGKRPVGTFTEGRTTLIKPADPDNDLTADAGSGGGDVPVGAVKVVLTATTTRTYRGNYQWVGSSMVQGIITGTTCSCVAWFDASVLSGKTVQSAVLTLKRRAFGRAGAVKVKIGLCMLPYNTEDEPTGILSGEIGMISPDEKKDFGDTKVMDMAEDLALHPTYGLWLYTDDTDVMSGRNYSENYAGFEGTDGSAPVLTVWYTT